MEGSDRAEIFSGTLKSGSGSRLASKSGQNSAFEFFRISIGGTLWKFFRKNFGWSNWAETAPVGFSGAGNSILTFISSFSAHFDPFLALHVCSFFDHASVSQFSRKNYRKNTKIFFSQNLGDMSGYVLLTFRTGSGLNFG